MSTVKSILIEYKASDINSYILELSYKKIRFYTQHGVFIQNDEVYEITNPYQYKDLFDEKGVSRINYVQNGDYLYLFHPNYPIKTIYRKDNNWFIEDFEIKNGPWKHINDTISLLKYIEDENGTFIYANVSAFDEGMVGKYIRLTLEDTAVSGWVSNKSYVKGDYVYSDGKYYECVSAGTSGDIKPVHSFGIRNDGGISWEYKHSGYGIAKIDEYINTSRLKVTLIGEFPQEFKDKSTRYWELSVFGGDCIYPMAGTFYRGRFVIIADTDNIPTVYMSCSDDYNNFADKEFGEVLDTNAITVPLYSGEYASATFLIGDDILFAGTTAGEFSIDSADSSKPMSPSNTQYKKFSSFGSMAIKPVKVGSSLLYVSKKGVGIRNILYSFEKDGYESLDISLIGKHLLYKGIKKIVYQEIPDKVIWIVTQDGGLVGLTYMTEQKVCAFHRHDLNGKVIDIAVIPNPENNYEDLWVEVERDGNYCIEWLDIGLEQDGTNTFFVDSGLEITREFDNSFSGSFVETTGNLKGKEVTFRTNDENKIYLEGQYGDRSFNIYGKGDGIPAHCYVFWMINSSDTLSYNFILSQELVGLNVKVNHFYTKNGERKVETLIDGIATSTYLNFNTSILGENDEINIVFTKVTNREDVALSGLDHLEGKVVVVQVDGAQMPNQTVENGSIKVPYYAKKVVAGLPIASIYVPQTIYITGNNGSGIGDVQRIDHVTLMLWKSLGGQVGGGFDSFQDILYRSSFERMDKGTPLFTGNKTVLLNTSTSSIEDKGAMIVIYNDSVYPMNILAIAPHLTTSGNGL
jgi:hypothetical protein